MIFSLTAYASLRLPMTQFPPQSALMIHVVKKSFIQANSRRRTLPPLRHQGRRVLRRQHLHERPLFLADVSTCSPEIGAYLLVRSIFHRGL